MSKPHKKLLDLVAQLQAEGHSVTAVEDWPVLPVVDKATDQIVDYMRGPQYKLTVNLVVSKEQMEKYQDDDK